MPPRLQLLRLWIVVRLASLATAAAFAGFLLSPLDHGDSVTFKWHAHDGHTAHLAVVISSVTVALVFTHRNRGRVHKWLGSLGKSGSAQQEAAAVSALISGEGGGGVAAKLETAQSKFVVLALADLTAADLAPGADIATATELKDRVRPARLGECDAFISHSWRDDGDSKYARLHEHEWHVDAPTIWFDRACSACSRLARKRPAACMGLTG